MSTFIDGKKLKAEIERRIAAYQKNFDKADNKIAKISTDGYISSLQAILPFITSLQQEQPVLPGIEEEGVPGKDYIPVEWVDACEKYGKWKIIQQEQESVAERFARIVRGNLIGIDKDVQQKFEQLYFEVTGNKMYGGYND